MVFSLWLLLQAFEGDRIRESIRPAAAVEIVAVADMYGGHSYFQDAIGHPDRRIAKLARSTIIRTDGQIIIGLEL
jgi:hypothetical protein